MDNDVQITATFVDEAAAGIDALTARMEELGGSVDALTTKMSAASTAAEGSLSTSLKSVGSTLKDAGTSLSTYVTVPLVGIGVASSVMAAKFQQNMELLHTEAGIPQAALQGLSQSILNLSSQTGQGPDALAEAMYHIASNAKGVLTSAQMLDQLKISAEAASMTGASLDDTTYTLSSTLASGITGAQGYASMMGILNGIVGAGDMKFQDLNAAIGTGFLATGAQFGISVQSMGAALDTLTDNGESADEAATRLRMSVTLMSAPSSQAAKVLNALGLSGSEVTAATSAATAELANAGVTTTQLADDMRKPDGINVALQDLKSHLEASGLSADGADAAIAKAFGGGRSDAAILTLLNNTTRTGEAFDQINKSSSDFQKLWSQQQATPMQQFKDDWAAIQADMVKLGDQLLPVVVPWINKLADGITNLTNWFTKLTPVQKEWALGIAGVAALIGPVLVIIGTIAGAIGNIAALFALFGGGEAAAAAIGVGGLGVALGPVSLAIIGIAAAAVGVGYVFSALSKNSEDLSKTQNDVTNTQNAMTAAADKYGKNSPQYQAAVQANKKAVQEHNSVVNDGASKVQNLINNWQTAIPMFISNIPAAIAKIVDPSKNAHDQVKSIQDAFTDLYNYINKNAGQMGMSILNGIGGALKSLMPSIAQALAGLEGILSDRTQVASGGKSPLSSAQTKSLISTLTGPIPGFSGGVTNFAGGLAYVHQGEVLANLPSGTDVIPASQVNGGSGSNSGDGVTVNMYNTINTPMDMDAVARDVAWRLANAN